ncbi:MAG: HD domain-containing protein [Alphaproteobacteria bacterium]|nr:HD domain-containing protein [Alphaproteobacteria bacterium]
MTDHSETQTAGEGEELAQFTRMDEGTAEDWEIIGKEYMKLAGGVVDRVLAHMQLLKDDFGGFQVDRLTHCLQTATRAYRDGRDEEYVVCCLLHDIGDVLGTYHHGAVAAAILKPFVSEANRWMLENHTDFQGYYYYEFVGLDKNRRDKFKDSPYYEHTREFIDKYDMPAFDPDYPTMSLDEFEPMMRRVMRKQLKSKIAKYAAE